MRHRRQLCNGQLAAMGLRPLVSWQVEQLRIGDEICLLIVPEDELPRRLVAVVDCVCHHGHYLLVTAHADDRQFRVRLPIERPDDWGVVECRIVKRHYAPLLPFRHRR